MRVLVWPADLDGGSGWYRLRFPALALAGQGADIEVTMHGPVIGWDRDWSHLPEPPLDAQPLVLTEKPDADVVVLQRPGRAHWTEIIPLLQTAGVRVVGDVDDDFDAIPAGNVARRDYDPKINPRHNRDWIRRACDLADLVTVSTPHLAGVYGRHGRVQILPNLVSASYLTLTSPDPLPRTVGWSGSVDTHPGDLETVGGAVRDTLAEHPDWQMHVVGTGKGVASRLRIDQVNAVGRWLPFGSYPAQLARLAVGIVPLQMNRFNRAKSALKFGEMSALGVPTIAAPTPDNQRLHDMGVGFLAARPADWLAHLRTLLGSEQARTDLAGRSREVMATQTYEQHCGRWLAAWSKAFDRKAVAA